MKDVVIVGAGRIGSTLADWLSAAGRFRVTIIDKSQSALDCLDVAADINRFTADVTDTNELSRLMEGKFAVLSAAPYHLTKGIAAAAGKVGAHYLDLTEDVAATRAVREIAREADCAFIPQCGLAPGFVTIVANDIARGFDTLIDVKMRVGALPEFPSNALNYNLTWSTDGVINEYCEPCEAIVNGSRREVPALEEREEFSLDGVLYEAFNTSGGLGSLCESLQGRVQNLNYRTIRYPGHAAIMKVLLNDLRMRDRRGLLKEILEAALPSTVQDVVVIFVAVSGLKQGRLMQETYATKIYSQHVNGRRRSAIQVTTAAGVCGVLELLVSGELPSKGLVRQEDIPLEKFLSTSFGRVFAARQDVDAASVS